MRNYIVRNDSIEISEITTGYSDRDCRMEIHTALRTACKWAEDVYKPDGIYASNQQIIAAIEAGEDVKFDIPYMSNGKLYCYYRIETVIIKGKRGLRFRRVIDFNALKEAKKNK